MIPVWYFRIICCNILYLKASLIETSIKHILFFVDIQYYSHSDHIHTRTVHFRLCICEEVVMNQYFSYYIYKKELIIFGTFSFESAGDASHLSLKLLKPGEMPYHVSLLDTSSS